MSNWVWRGEPIEAALMEPPVDAEDIDWNEAVADMLAFVGLQTVPQADNPWVGSTTFYGITEPVHDIPYNLLDEEQP